MWDLTAAADYVRLNSLDNEDFLDADDTKKTAILNVASRTLTRKYSGLTIPDEAVYLFGAVLAAAYNDTNKIGKQGVASFSVKGITYSFQQSSAELEDYITQDIADIIGQANGVKLGKRTVKWAVL